jgi:hypothetical protein
MNFGAFGALAVPFASFAFFAVQNNPAHRAA